MLGRVLAASVIAAFQVLYFIVLGTIFGATIQGGVLGLLCVLAIGIVAGTGFGALGVLLALRSRSASTVQGIFPLVFVVLFISSAFFPLELLASPADVVAQYNPLSFIAEGMRQPIAFSNAARAVLEGLLAAAARRRRGHLAVDRSPCAEGCETHEEPTCGWSARSCAAASTRSCACRAARSRRARADDLHARARGGLRQGRVAARRTAA